jgi:hypothetical protein
VIVLVQRHGKVRRCPAYLPIIHDRARRAIDDCDVTRVGDIDEDAVPPALQLKRFRMPVELNPADDLPLIRINDGDRAVAVADVRELALRIEPLVVRVVKAIDSVKQVEVAIVNEDLPIAAT